MFVITNKAAVLERSIATTKLMILCFVSSLIPNRFKNPTAVERLARLCLHVCDVCCASRGPCSALYRCTRLGNDAPPQPPAQVNGDGAAEASPKPPLQPQQVAVEIIDLACLRAPSRASSSFTSSSPPALDWASADGAHCCTQTINLQMRVHTVALPH